MPPGAVPGRNYWVLAMIWEKICIGHYKKSLLECYDTMIPGSGRSKIYAIVRDSAGELVIDQKEIWNGRGKRPSWKKAQTDSDLWFTSR